MINLDDYDIPEDAFRLKNLLDGVLQTVVSLYESYNMPLPTRRYTTMASPTIDCEQVVVSFVNAYLGTPGDEASTPLQCNSPRSAVVSISIAREAAVMPRTGRTVAAPSEEALQKVADIAALDTWILLDNLNQFDSWNEFGPGLGVIATANAEKTDGGYQTVSLQLTLAVG